MASWNRYEGFWNMRRTQAYDEDEEEIPPGHSPYNDHEYLQFQEAGRHDAHSHSSTKNHSRGSKNTKVIKSNRIDGKKGNNKHSHPKRPTSEGGPKGGANLGKKNRGGNKSRSINNYEDDDGNTPVRYEHEHPNHTSTNNHGIGKVSVKSVKSFLNGRGCLGELSPFYFNHGMRIDKASNRCVIMVPIHSETSPTVSLPIIPIIQQFPGDIECSCCYHLGWSTQSLMDLDDEQSNMINCFGVSGIAVQGMRSYTNENEIFSHERDDCCSGSPPTRTPVLSKNPSLDFIGHLMSIDVSSNKLIRCPLWMFLLPHLELLDLSDNFLSQLPEHLLFPADCLHIAPKLKSLHIGSNKFKKIPNLLSSLYSLESLSMTKLECVNWEEWEQFRLCEEEDGKPSLTSLDLSHNHLAALPSFCFTLAKSLKHFYLKDNNLNDLCDKMCLLTQLETLDVSHNNLQSMDCFTQTSHPQLITYNASNNKLTVVSLVLLAVPSLEVFDVSKNFIQTFCDMEYLELDCLDGKKPEKVWCSAAERARPIPPRNLSIIVDQNQTEMQPPKHAFKSPAILKRFLSQLRIVDPFLEKYRKHGEQLEAGKQVLRNINRLRQSCCGQISHAKADTSFSFATTLANHPRFYLCNPNSVAVAEELMKRRKLLSGPLHARVVAVHVNASVDLEVEDEHSLTGWLVDQQSGHVVSALPLCDEKLVLDYFETSTELVPLPPLLYGLSHHEPVAFNSETTIASTTPEDGGVSPLSHKARRILKKSSSQSSTTDRSNSSKQFASVQLINGTSAPITLSLELPLDEAAPAPGILQFLGRSAMECFGENNNIDDNSSWSSIVFRSMESLQVLDSDESLLAALRCLLATPTPPPTTPTPSPSPSPILRADSSDSFKKPRRKQRKHKKPNGSSARNPLKLTPVPAGIEGPQVLKILPLSSDSSMVRSPKPSRPSPKSPTSRMPSISPMPSTIIPLRLMVWFPSPVEVATSNGGGVGSGGGDSHVSSQEVSQTMVNLCHKCCSHADRLLFECSSGMDPDVELIAFFSAPLVDPQGVEQPQLATQRELKILLTEVTSSVVVPAARFPKDVTDFLGDPPATPGVKPRYVKKPGTRTYNPRWVQFSGHGKDDSEIKKHQKAMSPKILNEFFEENSAYINFACPLLFDEGTPSKSDFIQVLQCCSRLEGVFMNACSTGSYAHEIGSALPDVAVVAWAGSPSDQEAYIWAKSFYQELGKQFGRHFEQAYDEALKRYRVFWNRPEMKQEIKRVRFLNNNKNLELLEPILVRRKGRSYHPPLAAAPTKDTRPEEVIGVDQVVAPNPTVTPLPLSLSSDPSSRPPGPRSKPAASLLTLELRSHSNPIP